MTESSRLPLHTIPTHYDLALRPNLETDSFSGSVVIAAETTKATNSIVLNSEGLEIRTAAVSNNGLTQQPRIEVDDEQGQIALRITDTLTPGETTIELHFSGQFNDQLVGLYASTFEKEGEALKLATTQFEATHARKCFPCWDEPAFKSTFSLSITVEQGHEAVANSAERSRTANDDATTTIVFEPTIKMSTYLVAFVVGPLEMTDPVMVRGVPLRIVHVPGKSALTPFALEVGAFALDYFTEYFGIEYPGDKLDLVAIPDFAFGAMENLGCVTFREVLLLIDPGSATQPELQRSTDVINHEIAHMWFGDLVTMKWWNGLWLNEAFATFMEMRCTDAFRPQWQRWVEFGVSRSDAFSTDSLQNTRPIEFEVIHPEDAESMFDVLTYEKGAAVVRMAEQFLGEKAFQAGIARYMHEHSYSNAETTDLWDALEAETGQPVRKMMDTWIFQGGFPTITSSIKDSTLTLTQKRVTVSTMPATETSEQLWSVPVQYRWLAEGETEPTTDWVSLEGETASVELGATPQWVVLNAEAASFVRIGYTATQLDHLADIAESHLSAIERYNLIDDTWASVQAGDISSISYLTLLEALAGESDRSVWLRIIKGLHQIRRLVTGDARNRFEDIAHDILSPALANLGLGPVDGDSDRTKQLRGDLIRAFGIVANNDEIQKEAKRAVASEIRNAGLVDAAVLAAAVDISAQHGDEVDFDEFVAQWKSATSPQIEQRYLGALCDFPDDELVGQLRDRVLSGEVRSQNGPHLLQRALTNEFAGPQTWEFIKTNWDQLTTQFPTASIVRMVSGITALVSPEQVADCSQFFADNPVSTGQLTLAQILERQQVEAELTARESDVLRRFLTN